MTGIYVHVPFCLFKCPYCDFYSLPLTDPTLPDRYVAALERAMTPFAGVAADTLYFGGGTPSLLGGDRLHRLIETVRRLFALSPDAEITLEANPADDLRETLAGFAAAGGNRLSIGMQASTQPLLTVLGRRHTPADLIRTVTDARARGIDTISMDMMLAVPGQTAADVERDAETCAMLGAAHVSAYLLKLEAGTPFFEQQDTLALPDEDTAASLYLAAVDALTRRGFGQYEISNFAVPGRQSRHNLKYWDAQPYLGFGPAAHSFFDNRRFYYPRDLQAFLNGCDPIPETDETILTGGETEYAMLRLRLTAGLCGSGFAARFAKPLPSAWLEAAARLPETLVQVDDETIRLTPAGFLVSNAVIAKILNL